MKTKLLPLVSLLMISFFSCKDDDNQGNNHEGCFIEVPCTEPNGLISVAEADVLEEHYKDVFYGLFNEGNMPYNGYDGAVRYIWFDLDEIKKYIVYIEQNAQENGYDNLGLRVYLGAKDQLGQDGEVYPRQTVFFVPTTNPSGGSDVADNLNIVNAKRLNLGGAGIPDSVDQEEGVGAP